VKAKVTIRLKPGVLDPQGAAVRSALAGLGFQGVGDARVGRVIELDLDTKDRKEATRMLEQMCARLLANPVMEEYSVELQGAKG
jgi:phosphoribosylformylglycinamidine synthase PurS subunit